MTITFNQLQAFINFYSLQIDNREYETRGHQRVNGLVEGRELNILVSYGSRRVHIYDVLSNTSVTKELIK